jgi:glutamate dehydrogenase/leucine dehydrogenase
VGKVGFSLVRHLLEERARITVADVSPLAVARVVEAAGAENVEVVEVEKAHAVVCDIYSPCALGGALSATTIPELHCAAVVGSANNQLADGSCAAVLAAAGVLYAPDFVANAGGLINIAEELSPAGYHPARAQAAIQRIFHTTSAVIATAEADAVTTAEAAERLAEARMSAMAHVHQIRRSG